MWGQGKIVMAKLTRRLRGYLKLSLAAKFALAALCVAAGQNTASAQGGERLRVPTEGGFSGFITPLVGYANVKSQFHTDGNNRRTSSLNSSGQTSSNAVVGALFELRYTFLEARTEVYGGIPAENIREGGFTQAEIGVRHWLGDGTRLSLGVLPEPIVPNKTWQDPFIVDGRRSRTNLDSIGLRARVDNILETRLGLRYEFVRQEVDDERSGSFLASQPGNTLTQDDLDSLERDADFHRFTATYGFPITEQFFLRPGLRYTYGDADGDSNSFDAIRPELGMFYSGERFDTSLNLLYERSWFDEENPIYDDKRDANDFGATFLFGYKKPFGWESFRIDTIASFRKSDSDIDFYDARGSFISVGGTYFW